jgi:hypothetical protein
MKNFKPGDKIVCMCHLAPESYGADRCGITGIFSHYLENGDFQYVGANGRLHTEFFDLNTYWFTEEEADALENSPLAKALNEV